MPPRSPETLRAPTPLTTLVAVPVVEPVLVAPASAHGAAHSMLVRADSSSSSKRDLCHITRDRSTGVGFSMVGDDDAAAAAVLEGYSQHQNTPTQRTVFANRRHPLLISNFVQGNLYGSLRMGDSDGVSLFAKRYAGYVLSAIASGYMDVAVGYVLLQLEPEILGLESKKDLQGLIDLQWAVVLLLGVISDAFAPFGLRRNAYIVFGWMCASAIWVALFVLFQFSDHIFGSAVPPASAATTGITLAMLALVVATNALDIRVIELSQQEDLLSRGRLVATYQITRVSAQVALHILVWIGAGSSSVMANNFWYLTLPFPIAFFLLHLALVALLPIPFVLYFAHEGRLEPGVAAPHLGETLRQFWQSGQQKAIRQLVVFNCVLYFFALFSYGDVMKALWVWTHESQCMLRVRFIAGNLALVAALLCWRRYGVNASWVSSIAATLIFWSLAYLTGSSLVAFDIARVSWLPAFMSVLHSGMALLLLLSAFVPTIEIAQQGSEGTTFGLLSSFQSIAKVLGVQLASAIRDTHFGESLAISTADIAANSSATQRKVFWGVVALTGIKLLALLTLWFCPQGKVDAQQLRIYGDYSRPALLALVSFYVVGYLVATFLEYRRLL